MPRPKKWPFPHTSVDHRPAKAFLLAQNPLLTIEHQGGNVYSVRSSSRPLSLLHTVRLGATLAQDKCSCEDFKKPGRPKPCIHPLMTRFRFGMFPGVEPSPEEIKVAEMYLGAVRYNYPGEPKSVRIGSRLYHNLVARAYEQEEVRFPELLSELCYQVEKVERTDGPGRPRVELRDALYGIVLHAYQRKGWRKLGGLVIQHIKLGYTRTRLFWTTYRNYAGPYDYEEGEPISTPSGPKPTAVTEKLYEMLMWTAMVAREVEFLVAVDATGESTARIENHRMRKNLNPKNPNGAGAYNPAARWARIHIAYGISTNMILGIVVTASAGAGTGEPTQFPELMRQVFAVMKATKYVIADSGLAHEEEFNIVRRYGALLIAPPSRRWKYDTKKILGGDYALAVIHRLDDLFYRVLYRMRNKVELGFRVFKHMFQTFIAAWIETNQTCTIRMVNEMLARAIAHNLCKINIQEHLRGVRISFEAGTALPFVEALDPVARVELRVKGLREEMQRKARDDKQTG